MGSLIKGGEKAERCTRREGAAGAEAAGSMFKAFSLHY